MNILIIEDEPLVAKDLQNLLSRIEPGFIVNTVIGSVKESVDWFKTNTEPDLAFMDIQLSDGVSFDIFKEFEPTCPIIFTTAYNQYAIRAFKLNSVDYLLKPIDPEELKTAIEKFKKFKGHGIKTQLEELIHDMQEKQELKRYKERFMVQTRNTLMPVKSDQVAYFIKEELIYLMTTDNHKYLSENHSMDEIENLCDPRHFYQANRQFIVNIEAVERVKSSYNGKIIALLKPPYSNIEIDISREKAADFKEWLDC